MADMSVDEWSKLDFLKYSGSGVINFRPNEDIVFPKVRQKQYKVLDQFNNCICCGAKWNGNVKCFYCKTIIDPEKIQAQQQTVENFKMQHDVKTEIINGSVFQVRSYMVASGVVRKEYYSNGLLQKYEDERINYWRY